MKECILPYGDILAWCLMPNHFHWMIYMREETVTHPMTPSHRMSTNPQTLNQSIAILLRSYTRAINRQENRSGSLFRPKTKAECITKMEGITPSFYNTSFGTQINTHDAEEEYPQVCFNYIHNNPVSAGLVSNVTDWEFSSANDYFGNRKGTLINRDMAQKTGLLKLLH